MEALLNKLNLPFITTAHLLELFKAHKYPRDKIKYLVTKGELINVKQGIYILGPEYKKSYSKEVLAGILYGPSIITLEYALSIHGLIPERVEVVTSCTFKRNKKFITPIGTFTYRYVPSKVYSIGVQYIQAELGNYFIALPERALCDLIHSTSFTSCDDVMEYLIGSLRIEEEEIKKLDLVLLLDLKKAYRRRSVNYLVDAVAKIRG